MPYIDAIEAKAAIKDLFADMPRIDFMDNRDRWRKENEQYLRCLDVLSSLPTVDAVQVVRCRNCLHGKTLGDVGTWCNRHEDLWPNNGYCSKAERRSDG